MGTPQLADDLTDASRALYGFARPAVPHTELHWLDDDQIYKQYGSTLVSGLNTVATLSWRQQLSHDVCTSIRGSADPTAAQGGPPRAIAALRQLAEGWTLPMMQGPEEPASQGSCCMQSAGGSGVDYNLADDK